MDMEVIQLDETKQILCLDLDNHQVDIKVVTTRAADAMLPLPENSDTTLHIGISDVASVQLNLTNSELHALRNGLNLAMRFAAGENEPA